jgi:8-hydroxy-5-deazaflavin:NADPH oxidoreductase
VTITGVTTIGFIGAGNIGSTVAQAAIKAGYDVVIANSRGPETLSDLIGRLGPKARAATATEAAATADLVVVAVPLRAISTVPVSPLAGKTVIDTNNYYPARDGHVAELDAHQTTSSQLLQNRLPDSRVVKGFNHIVAAQIISDARDASGGQRRALAFSATTPRQRRS